LSAEQPEGRCQLSKSFLTESHATLKEMLGPSLRAVIVGINPSLKSVERGHYWQGRHGQQMWNLLRESKIVSLRLGIEDEDSFDQGIGFADLIRKPTRSAKELTLAQKHVAVPSLIERIETACGTPVIIFRYKGAYDIAAAAFQEKGFRVLRMPSPYASAIGRDALMKEITEVLNQLS
jgi:double-stranded uracil-DNA glycosylase